jgi:hypothetical protein
LTSDPATICLPNGFSTALHSRHPLVFFGQWNPPLAPIHLLKTPDVQFSVYIQHGLGQARLDIRMAAFAPRALAFHWATWRDSGSVCSLADSERHLGHIVRADKLWLAFDATHVNDTGTGFRLLGSCTSITAAKHAVEQVLEHNRGITATLQ